MIARLVEKLDKHPRIRSVAQLLALWLQRAGLWPTPPDMVADIEELMGRTLKPVNTPDGFRRNLGQNLALAAQRRTSGFILERPRGRRHRLTMAISAGLLMAMVTTLVLAFRSRPAATDR